MIFQQLLEHVEQLSRLTEVAQLGLSTSEPTPQLGQSIWTSHQQQWQMLQCQLSTTQQALTLGLQRLQQRITQIELLQGISEHLDAQVDIANLLEASLDAIWQKVPLRFAVIVLGEAELGPYTYQRMRGVTDAWRFIGKACPFPLWGVLARALLPRLDPEEADYLVIQDICTAKRPRPEEFPWMTLDGSMMILPLRTQNRVIGAILLGRESVDGFVDQELCHDFYILAHTTARILQIAQVRHELDERSNQLLSLQLFTKSIASIQNVEKLIDSTIEGIRETFGRVTVLIYLNDRVWSKEVTTYGELDAYVRSIIDWTMQAGQPIFYDPDDTTESLERFYYNESGRALVTPIIRNDRTLGAIQIVAQESARPFAEGDMIVLRTIANAVAMIL
jgi:GAF domain